MDLRLRIDSHFQEAAAVLEATRTALAGRMMEAADVLVQCLLHDGKILVCGLGGSAAVAQHLTGELVGRFSRERPGLPVIALNADSAVLTALAHDYGFEHVFARQVQAMGHAGDVLLVVCPSGNADSVIAAVDAAQERGMPVVALSGRHGGQLGELLGPGDVHLCVPHDAVARIQEIHELIIHCLCDAIDCALLGEED